MPPMDMSSQMFRDNAMFNIPFTYYILGYCPWLMLRFWVRAFLYLTFNWFLRIPIACYSFAFKSLYFVRVKLTSRHMIPPKIYLHITTIIPTRYFLPSWLK